ncbi:MAG: NAD(P)H-binding protein [Deltaproteobacteria bacterium]|nr:NAD(P)H-binding protein [Deltaproteobacteria bacterium]
MPTDFPLKSRQTRPVHCVGVTGGTGFIGKAIIHQLTQAKLAVRALVRPASRSACFDHPHLTWVSGHLGDSQSLQRLVAGTDALVHCAGAVRGRNLADFAPTNIDGVANLVRAARGTGTCRRFLHLSSLAAREPHLSAYAASKNQGERVLQKEAGDLCWTILRPPAVYGPGERELLPLLQWLQRGLLFTPGAEAGRFSMIFISDLAGAVQNWLQSDTDCGGCYTLDDGTPQGYTWDDLRDIGRDVFSRSVHRIKVPASLLGAVAGFNLALARLGGYRPMLTPGKVRELCHPDWVCDHREFSRVTGWQPQVVLAEGLCRLFVR